MATVSGNFVRVFYWQFQDVVFVNNEESCDQGIEHASTTTFAVD